MYQQKTYEDSGTKEKYEIDGEYKAGIMLLDILNKTKCPLNMFEKIVEWAVHCSINYNVTFNASTKINRNDILCKIITKYNWSGLQPMESSLKLTACNEEVNVVHFDFKQALYSILTDSNLMQKQNLLDSIHKAIESKVLDDLDMGYAFQNGIVNFIKYPKLEEHVPIVFWIDKTHMDVHARLKLEPLMMTLGAFNWET